MTPGDTHRTLMPPVSVSSGVLFPGGEGGAGTGGPALDHPPPLRLPGPPVPGEGTPPPMGTSPLWGHHPVPPGPQQPWWSPENSPQHPWLPPGSPHGPMAPCHPHVPIPAPPLCPHTMVVSPVPIPSPCSCATPCVLIPMSPCPCAIPVALSPHRPCAVPVSPHHPCVPIPTSTLCHPCVPVPYLYPVSPCHPYVPIPVSLCRACVSMPHLLCRPRSTWSWSTTWGGTS